jgi:hypothetical protein
MWYLKMGFFFIRKRKKSCRERYVEQAGCSRTIIVFFTKNLTEIAGCEGVLSWFRSTFQGMILAPHNKPGVSNIPKTLR